MPRYTSAKLKIQYSYLLIYFLQLLKYMPTVRRQSAYKADLLYIKLFSNFFFICVHLYSFPSQRLFCRFVRLHDIYFMRL